MKAASLLATIEDMTVLAEHHDSPGELIICTRPIAHECSPLNDENFKPFITGQKTSQHRVSSALDGNLIRLSRKYDGVKADNPLPQGCGAVLLLLRSQRAEIESRPGFPFVAAVRSGQQKSSHS
jgi:hypothetical protein